MANKLYSVTVVVTKAYDVLVEANTLQTAKVLVDTHCVDVIERIGSRRKHETVKALCARKLEG